MIDPLALRPSDIVRLRKGEYEDSEILEGLAHMFAEVDTSDGSLSDEVYSAARKLSAAGVWKKIGIKALVEIVPNDNPSVVSDFVSGLPLEVLVAIDGLLRKPKREDRPVKHQHRTSTSAEFKGLIKRMRKYTTNRKKAQGGVVVVHSRMGVTAHGATPFHWHEQTVINRAKTELMSGGSSSKKITISVDGLQIENAKKPSLEEIGHPVIGEALKNLPRAEK